MSWSAYPTWLNAGDNAWQMTAATFVGLMSLPGLAVLYGGVMQKRWSVNSMMLTFVAFCLVLVAWCLWAFKMGFGHPIGTVAQASAWPTLLGQFGHRAACSGRREEGQAVIPSITEGPPFHFPQASLVYFQFVFAAITPILMLGSVLGRINFKAWIPFVLLWITFVYTVNAFLIWGGGYFAAHGALDYSGGYVIHLAAGISGFVAAAVIGPRLQRDREIDAPNNLLMVAGGRGPAVARLERLQRRGLLLRGRQRLGGGAQHEPLHRGGDARVDRLGLHLPRQAVADRLGQRDDHRPGRDHPGGRLRQRLRRDRDRRGRLDDRVDGDPVPQPSAGVPNVDDTLGVIYTHGIAGLTGGLLVGVLADPHMVEYIGVGGASNLPGKAGVIHGSWTLLRWQAETAGFVIIFSGIMTFILLKLVGIFVPCGSPTRSSRSAITRSTATRSTLGCANARRPARATGVAAQPCAHGRVGREATLAPGPERSVPGGRVQGPTRRVERPRFGGEPGRSTLRPGGSGRPGS